MTIQIQWRACLCAVLSWANSLQASGPQDLMSDAASFRDPPAAARTRMFWRVFGPAWTPPEIDYQLGLLKDAGVGGVMTFFMYPVALDGLEVHNQKYFQLGRVHEAADVSVNGERAGSAWTYPFEVEITRHLKPGTNLLSITVVNAPLNRFLGAPDVDLKPLRAVYGNRFPAPEEKLLIKEPAVSGLLDPVKIRYAMNESEDL
jgi:hypothetical protein